MPASIRSFVDIVLLLLCGCSGLQSSVPVHKTSALNADFVELREVSSCTQSTRVVISSLGVSRVEINNSTPFIFSADREEAQRVINLAHSTIEMLNKSPAPKWRLKVQGTISIICRQAGQLSTIEVTSIEPDRDLVLNGLIEEIKIVGSTELAFSLKLYLDSQTLTGNDLYAALYVSAATFAEWSRIYCRHHDITGWEPTVGEEMRYADAGGKLHAVTGAEPKDIPKLPGIVKQDQNRLLRRYLEIVLEGFILSKSVNATIVSAVSSVFALQPPVPELVEQIRYFYLNPGRR